MPLVLALALLLGSPGALGQDDYRAVRTDEYGVLDQLNDLDRELAATQLRRREIEARMAELEESLRRHEDDAAVAEARLEKRRPQVKQRVRALYRLHRRGLARMIFGAEDPAELRRRSAYLVSILQADLERMRDYSAAIVDRSAAREALEKDAVSLKGLKADYQLHEAELREQRARRYQRLQDIRRSDAQSRQAFGEYDSAGVRLINQLDSLGGSRASIEQQATMINPERGFRDAHGLMPWPTSGTLRRRFGPYRDNLTGAQGNSLGILIQADFGTPIRAVYNGQVKLVSFVAGYGQTVAVEHGSYTTVYYHAGAIEVQVGDTVRQGDVLGVVGSSGYTDGDVSVLGFELRYNGEPQDPLPWLSSR
ncbi:MAG: peptidoglycan DD-metalloendopeptidase family protein [Alphaproteobacteria bacterium]|nr:peptidoglycan DD-metalloendopeptidase family protein [Alphaproteobacteria bacterium]